MIDNLKQIMLTNEKIFSQYACKSERGIKINKEKEDIRPIFFRDIDKIIHSQAYTRYIDKTQVYAFIENDHITHRVLHVQLVAKEARTIGRALGLNEDLIEAIALGHDVGHTPFGHAGEKFLNNIAKREEIGYFCHNAQSVKMLKDLENLNLTVQTLDGILAHNGEILLNKYETYPNKTKEQFLEEVEKVFTEEGYSKKIKPMTLEGSVVRLSDIIAYIGRDIEDAIIVGTIKREDIPKEITEVLGNTNAQIVNTLIMDVIENSINKPYLKFSNKVFESLIKLKAWNYEHIYNSKEVTKNLDILGKAFYDLFEYYLKKLDNRKHIKVTENLTNSDKLLFSFMNNKTEEYKKNTDIRRIVIDYISGQTDKFFLKECEQNLKNFKI